jgi:hypothetical protein
MSKWNPPLLLSWSIWIYTIEVSFSISLLGCKPIAEVVWYVDNHGSFAIKGSTSTKDPEEFPRRLVASFLR